MFTRDISEQGHPLLKMKTMFTPSLRIARFTTQSHPPKSITPRDTIRRV